MSGGSDPRALRELIREASRDELPELDWDRIESRLFAELDETAAADGAAGAERASLPPAEREASAPAALVATPVVATVRDGVVRDSVVPPLPLAELATAEPKAQRGSRWGRSWGAWAIAAAVAAAVGGLWLSHDGATAPGSQPVIVAEAIDAEKIPFAPGMDGRTRDLSHLKSGDVVEAAVGPLAFGQAGSLEWSLSAGSRLVVREALAGGDSLFAAEPGPAAAPRSWHVVDLENGSMRGSVAAGASSRLVISAGETEIMSVAAGSIFSVTRSSRRVVVHLEAGSATVGSRSAAGAAGPAAGARLLEAPMIASFSLDGGSSFEVIADAASLDPFGRKVAVAPVANATPVDQNGEASVLAQGPAPASSLAGETRPIAAVASAKLAPAASSAATSAAPSAGSAAPIASAPASAVQSTSSLTSTLVGCLSKAQAEKQKNAADGVRVQIASTLSLKIREDGSVQSAVFSPSLTPELQSCAVFLLRSRLESGARTVSIPVNLP